MTFKEALNREKYVVIHGQTPRFRLIKWVIILVVMAVLVYWKGWSMALFTFFAFCLLGICVHFLLRWKTDGWRKSWGPYKKIPIDVA